MDNYLFIPFLPLAAFFVNIIFGRNYIKDKAHWVSILAVFGSWVVSVMTVADVLQEKPVIINKDLYTWIDS
ncbi:MAG TPA: hypothetical protein VN328_02975, partial [Thermodesulfovibrionales bacterium]|nr:hypothetical protein [Thermodesulfovibrionales bacterium]